MKSVYIATISLLYIFTFFTSCNEESNSNIRVFKYNQTNHITSLDPAFAKSQNNIWADHHLFDGLVRLDDGLNVVPNIAKRYTISDDGLDYTFYLRDDVYFHKDNCFQTSDSTRRVTAQDFVYSMGRLIDDNVNSPGSWLFTDKIESSASFVALDDTTFRLRLVSPFIPMLGILTMQYCSVVPREAVEHYGAKWAQHPVGTGPFKFKRWVENQALYLTTNHQYFHGVHHNLDGIKTSFIPDRKIAFLEMMNGKLDFVSGLESSFAPMLLTREAKLKEEHRGVLRFQKAPYLNMEYLGININATPQESPLRKKLFRQALNYGVDRQLMLTALRNGVGRPADAGFVPAGLPSYDPEKVKGYTYDKAKAIALIKEAGYEDILTVPEIQLYTNNDYLDLTTFIAKQWEELGLRISIEVMESGILRQSMRNEELPFFRASWIADYPDPESFLCMFYSKYPAPPNYTRYSSPSFDNLYEQAIKTSDLTERIALYQKMDNMLVDDAPVIFLFYDEAALFSRSVISGVSANGINLLKVDSLRKGEK